MLRKATKVMESVSKHGTFTVHCDDEAKMKIKQRQSTLEHNNYMIEELERNDCIENVINCKS